MKKKNIKKEFGTLITNKLKTDGISYYAITKATDVRVNVIKSIEEGKASYTIDSLIKVCEFLGLKLDLVENLKNNLAESK